MGVQEAASRESDFLDNEDQLRGHLTRQPQDAECD